MVNVRGQIQAVPAWGWLAMAAVAGLGFLVWHNFVSDAADEDWHDPQQPDLNLNVANTTVPQPSQQPRAKCRPYPGSLASWSGSWVGDC